MKHPKYVDAVVSFNEIPDEVCLSISISGCTMACKGCHSPELQSDNGTDLDIETFDKLLRTIGKHCTCVCFLGGDNSGYTRWLLVHAKSLGYKTAIYTGRDDLMFGLACRCDYIKIGRYIHELGGLDSKTTNQRLYSNFNGIKEDITYKFWR